MKYTIFSRGDDYSNSLQEKLHDSLQKIDFIYDPEKPDIAISIGGDGTMLEAFHHFTHRLEKTAFLGIHTGHLGYYADWQPKEMELLLEMLAKPALKTAEYPILEVTIELRGQEESERYLALNESTVKSIEGSMVMNMEINNEHFETFRGDGLCISTPSGSTAYNKSLGGAIIHPALCAMQITEMASINNRVYRTIGSPLVLPYTHTCVLEPVNDRDFLISIDHWSLVEKDVEKITLRVAPEKVHFARYRPFPFWQRVKESFI